MQKHAALAQQQLCPRARPSKGRCFPTVSAMPLVYKPAVEVPGAVGDRAHARRRVGALAVCAAMLGIVIASVMTTSARAATYSEDAVKAAYLYRFIAYVEWPPDVQLKQPFMIAVLDAPAVAQELRLLLPAHPTERGIAQVREIGDLHDLRVLGPAQMLYVGAGHERDVRAAEPALGNLALLLVTDDPQGLQFGGIVNFMIIDHRVRFEVSLTAADRARLHISAELLAAAIRVFGGPRQS